MNCLSSVKNIFKNNLIFQSNVLLSKNVSTGNHNHTLRVDIKNPSEANRQNFKSFNRTIQSMSESEKSNEIAKKQVDKPFGTGEYNYTLTSTSSTNNNSSSKSK
uniref:Uncharacterized protein n=1 Tax=Strongyloides stercoralis TaxID=6248 RepID=A0A0K0EIJ3_STRER